MRSWWVVAAMLASASAYAQEECKKYPDHAVRLACYENYPIPPKCAVHGADPLMQAACLDVYHGRLPLTPNSADEARMCQVLEPESDAANKNFDAAYACVKSAMKPPGPPKPPTPAKDWIVSVREKSLPKFYKLDEPALIGFKRENHRSDPVLKAAIVADGPTLGFVRNWNWLLDADFNIDLSAPAKERANSKSIGGGARGVLGDYIGEGLALDSTIRAYVKRNAELHTRSAGAAIGTILAIKHLADGAPWASGKTTFQLIPSAGVTYDKLQEAEAGKPRGAYTSAYAGANLSVWPSFVQRTRVVVTAQRFIDLSATGQLIKRHTSYFSAGIEFYLYDPLAKDVKFTPRIALQRDVGDDPLTDTVDKNRTLFVFKFTLN